MSDYDYVVSPSPFSGVALITAYELPELGAPINDELPEPGAPARRASENRKWLQRVTHRPTMFRRLVRQCLGRKSDRASVAA
jgi:hypothetical protein